MPAPSTPLIFSTTCGPKGQASLIRREKTNSPTPMANNNGLALLKLAAHHYDPLNNENKGIRWSLGRKAPSFFVCAGTFPSTVVCVNANQIGSLLSSVECVCARTHTRAHTHTHTHTHTRAESHTHVPSSSYSSRISITKHN